MAKKSSEISIFHLSSQKSILINQHYTFLQPKILVYTHSEYILKVLMFGKLFELGRGSVLENSSEIGGFKMGKFH